MSTLHAPHSISGHECNVSLAKVVSIGAGACESARAGLFRSGVGVATAGSVLVPRRMVEPGVVCEGAWCGVRSENYFRRVTRNFRRLVGFACAHD